MKSRRDTWKPGQVRGWKDLRPEVQKFALLMESQLRMNDHKGGWKHEDEIHLMPRVRDETCELDVALMRGPGTAVPYGPRDVKARRRIGAEAADVANFCMMVADVAGAMKRDAMSTDLIEDARDGR
jgi:hypothetical protein